MWIQRKISPKLQELAKTRPALVLTGARQTGKTSLLKKLFPDHRYLSLDLPAEAAFAEQEPEALLEKHPPPLLIDEVQYAPGIFRSIKVDIDRHRKEFGRFILTGSQKFQLMREISDSLAGRVAILELETLSFSEVQSNPSSDILPFIVRGGYPELHDETHLNAAEYYRAYLATYLERDVRSVLNVGSLRDFERFVRAVALRSGQLLNKTELARDVGISPTTANQWLSVLSASNQIYLLEPWFSNRTKSLVKTPKIYWADTGLLCYLLGIHSVDDLVQSTYKGAIWETHVFAELRKQQTFHEGSSSLFFWRDRKIEVDFLIHRGGRFELYEAKWTTQVGRSETRHLQELMTFLGEERVISAKVLARNEESYPVTSKIRAVAPSDPYLP